MRSTRFSEPAAKELDNARRVSASASLLWAQRHDPPWLRVDLRGRNSKRGQRTAYQRNGEAQRVDHFGDSALGRHSCTTRGSAVPSTQTRATRIVLAGRKTARLRLEHHAGCE